jgi:hypothetical protein
MKFKEIVMETSVDAKNTEEQEVVKNPNELVSLLVDERTTIIFNDNEIVIKKVKIDEKNNTEKPIGEPITIARSAIASVKRQRYFNPLMVLISAGAGALIGFAFIGGVITLLICIAIGFSMAFPKRMVITRKDGTKFKVDLTEEVYEKLIKVLF